MSKTVFITFAQKPTADYPLAVVILDDTPGSRVPRGQDHLVRSLRDARLFANGMCAGGHWASSDGKVPEDWPINPTVDPRLLAQEG